MPYIIQASEKLRKSGAEAETKALLYLMNFSPDSDEIYYFVVDFFNDLTGMDRMGNKLWDLQSKANKNVGPKAIGTELVTLFKNYMSEIEFHTYILFVGSVTGTVRIDSSKDFFDISNVKPEAIEKIKEGVKEEGTDKKYVNAEDLTENNISAFLEKVHFVVDGGKGKGDYVRGIIKNHPNIQVEQEVLEAIFNEIRDEQSSKKNVNAVEGITIETSDEALNYCRHLTSNEIKLLALNRIIQKNILKTDISKSFVDVYNLWPAEKRSEKLEECQQSLYRALFNKNATDGFWGLFEKIYSIIVEHPDKGVQFIFNEVRKDADCISRCPDFEIESLKYFIALVKDGVQQ